MDANSEVENLISIFLESNMIELPILMKSTESVIKENHLKIITYLENSDVSEEIIENLKKELKLC